MKIAVSSQNFKSVTGHAGRSRRFIIFNMESPCDAPKVVWLDLPMQMAFHEFTGNRHPLDDMDVILTASAGPGFVSKLAQRGVKVVTCGESDPRKAVFDYMTGNIKPADTQIHLQERHEAEGQHACSCH